MTEAVETRPLPGATFGGLIEVADGRAFVEAAEARPRALPEALNGRGGLLLVKGLAAVSDDPGLLVRLSRPFGAEVEDYARTTNRLNLLHPDDSRIVRISNLPPVNFAPPEPPDPPTRPDGGPPIRFPHRRGWHTDQSFRRPPPDISLFYAHRPAPRGQGQTLYADGAGAYDALPPDLKAVADDLHGLHVAPFTGHGEDDVVQGRPRKPLNEKDGPVAQPVVRLHPETGRKALYLCEREQMDWVRGPFVGMEPGPGGEGARLLYRLMEHFTRDRFTYAHEWDRGDLIVYDNRCLIHSATWFDAQAVSRDMWRTTVWGNPGPSYRGEARSWETA